MKPTNPKRPITLTEHLTLRGLLIGLAGSLMITTSSMYVALRMGALPWPTLFVAVLSMAIIKRWKNSSLQEVNVTHTVMSAGAMVAGGLAFTIPGIWIAYPDTTVSTIQLVTITISGAVLGVIFTNFHRKRYLEESPLPYPMGTAAYNTITIGDAGGKQAVILFSSMGASALFTYLRDGIRAIPAAVSAKLPGKYSPDIHMWLSPMAVGIGFIIGPLYTGIWFLGTILGYLLIIPIGTAAGWFHDMAAADLFRQNLGIGLMVGTGAGILLKGTYTMLRTTSRRRLRLQERSTRIILLLILAVIITICTLTDITIIQMLLAVAGIWITTSMAAMLTGQTAINPMEIFGILVLLAIQLVQTPGPVPAFLIAALTAVACGLTGDVMNDFKSGKELGTNPRAQLIAETAGGIVGAIAAVFVLLIMKQAFGSFGTAELPAPQAVAVSQMVGGLSHVPAFFTGLLLGTLLYLGGLPTTTLGLGVYLSTSISTIVFVGGLIRFIIDRLNDRKKADNIVYSGSIIASGFLGGEGIVGVLLAIFSIF